MTSYAKIEIRDGLVYSTEHGDIYYSREDGWAESQYVFLDGNHLPARWRGKTSFCIAETGFGTGLNFMLTLQAWLKDPAASQSLNYVAIEAYPIHKSQLAEIHAHWPDLKAQSQALIEQYPDLSYGDHTLTFAEGRVQLQLIFAAAETALQDYTLRPDCWFLDGFAPSRNPSMWSKQVLNNIAGCSRPGTTLATFTAAGEIRRNLVEAGFEVKKRKGFGRKREMLRATMPGPYKSGGAPWEAPWFTLADITKPRRRVVVIGAGIAGAQTAWHLARLGIEVTVIEAKSKVAPAASGNLSGILAPKLTASASEGEAFYLAAFFYQLRQIKHLRQQGVEIAFEKCGLMHISHNAVTQARCEQLARRTDLPADLLEILSPERASAKLGEEVGRACSLIRSAGALSPGSLCRALLAHPNINLRLSVSLDAVFDHGGQPGLKLSTGESLEFDALVLANGYQAADFCQSIQIMPVRGQTSSARIQAAHAPRHALDHVGYVVNIPHDRQQLIFGASFEREDDQVDLRDSETRYNLDTLARCLPGLADHLTDIQSSHAGVRATTFDRWPIVGPLPDLEFFQREYADLQMGKQYKAYPQAHYQQGVYILSGLGSRGLASAAYCANLLAHMVHGSPPPAPTKRLHAMHPARFLVRDLKKGRKPEG